MEKDDQSPESFPNVGNCSGQVRGAKARTEKTSIGWHKKGLSLEIPMVDV